MPSAWRSRVPEDYCLAFSADRNGLQPGRLVVALQIDMAPSEYQRALNEVINGKFRCARLIVETFRRHVRLRVCLRNNVTRERFPLKGDCHVT